MSTTEAKANVHERVRRQHASELAQDYVEAIDELARSGRVIRVSDLQEVFGVSHVTVIRTLQRLEEQGLLESAKSKEIALSEDGKALASEAAGRHALLVEFLCHIGVSPEQADADAEGAEHHLSKETMSAIRRFLDRA
ncbi:MAG: iron dependent repressor, metal binding and dimerization domain protein [Verrucomicrobiota bacterium]